MRRHGSVSIWVQLAAPALMLACNPAQVSVVPAAPASSTPPPVAPPVGEVVLAPITQPVFQPGPTQMGNTPLIVINMPTAQPLAPPPLAKPPMMVALPDLPHPSSYPRPAKPPGPSETDECGVTWTGSEWVPNTCIDANAHTPQSKAAQVVIPYDRMRQPATAIPAIVDHRAEGTEGPVRKQTGNQCTAFAFTSALDHAYARWTGKPASFSVMQIWSRYHKWTEHAAAEANVGDSLGDESFWPYDGHLARTWGTCPPDPAKRTPNQICGATPDPAHVATLEATKIAEITQVGLISFSRLDVLRETLAAGQDVTVGLRLHSFATAGAPGAKYIIGEKQDGQPAKKKMSPHYLLLAGYAMTPNGNYYLVHNSWGTKWGDEGYAWVHEDVLKANNLGDAMYVPDLEPKQIADMRLRQGTGLPPMCGAGMFPDSISSLCAPACPDGSPRRNNVCATGTNECPVGTVNLTGACLMAAPRSSGTDPASGVGWQCSAGGCVYGIPSGRLGCNAPECGVSCPAPTFRLASNPNGLVCVE